MAFVSTHWRLAEECWRVTKITAFILKQMNFLALLWQIPRSLDFDFPLCNFVDVLAVVFTILNGYFFRTGGESKMPPIGNSPFQDRVLRDKMLYSDDTL